MNILYTVNQFPKLSESFIINEIYELQKRGHTVSVFSLNKPNEEVVHNELQDIEPTSHYAESPSLLFLPDLLLRRVLNSTILDRALFIDDPIYHARSLHLGKQIIRE